MKLQKQSITAALLIAGVASLYTPKAEAFSLVETFRGWFGSSQKVEEKVVKETPSVRAKTTPNTATTRTSATGIAIPAFKPTTAVEKLGHLDEFEVTKTSSTKDLNTNVLSFVTEEGHTSQFNVESSVDFIFLGNQIVGKDRYTNNWYVFRKGDNPDQPITAIKADGGALVENSNPMNSNPMVDQNSNPMGNSNPMINQNSNPMGNSNPMINQNSNPMNVLMNSNPMAPAMNSNPMAPAFAQ